MRVAVRYYGEGHPSGKVVITMEHNSKTDVELSMKSLLVLFSYHHKNTEKIAEVFAKVLDAKIKAPQQINPEELQKYDLIGFGSGIYSANHHESVLDLADKLPQVTNKKAFIFSTSALTSEDKVTKDHLALRKNWNLKVT